MSLRILLPMIPLTTLLLASTGLWSAPAWAMDFLLAGKKLAIQNQPDPEDTAKRSIAWSVADNSAAAGARGTNDDPRCGGAAGGGGGSIRFFSDASAGSIQDTGDIPLPCQNWVALGPDSKPKGYLYADKEQDQGPCRRVLVKDGALSARCSSKVGPLDYDLVPGTSEGRIGAVLTVGAGTIRYCTQFDAAGRRNGSDGKTFAGKKSAPPPVCPTLCGNGVRNRAETCDDGNTHPNDGCSATCTFETLCLITNNGGSPATSSLVRVATNGMLTQIGNATLPGNNTADGPLTATRCGRRVYMTLSDGLGSAIAGFDVALNGTLTALPTLSGLPYSFGLRCNESQNLLFSLARAPDFLGLAGKVLSFTIGFSGILTPAGVLDLGGTAFTSNMFADFHPTTSELYVVEAFAPPVVPVANVILNRVSYDLFGNLTLPQTLNLNVSLSSRYVRDIRFTADAGFLALPGYNAGTLCFSHWTAPGMVIPPLGSLNLNCGTPFPSDAKGFVPRPEGGPYFYYQSGTTLDAAEFSGTSIISHSSITPVHTTNQLLLAFGGQLLVSLGPVAGEVASYDVAPNLVTVTPNDTVAVGAGPDSGVLIPCPTL